MAPSGPAPRTGPGPLGRDRAGPVPLVGMLLRPSPIPQPGVRSIGLASPLHSPNAARCPCPPFPMLLSYVAGSRCPRGAALAPVLLAFGASLGSIAHAQDDLIPAPLTQSGNFGPFTGADFGERIAVAGDLMVVGAPLAKSSAGDTGAAFVYRRSAGVWNLEAELLPTAPQVGGHLGVDVDTDGTRVIVGGDFLDLDGAVDGDLTGGAYIFEQVSGTWSEVVQLTPPLPDALAQYGVSVAIDGDVALMSSATDLRPVQAYRRDGAGVWNLEDQLLPPNANPSSGFGSCVDVSGDRLMLGASNVSKDDVDFVGAISWWEYNNGVWAERALLQPPAEEFLYSGLDFALEGDVMVVGHPFATTNGVFSAGRVSVFEKATTGWDHTFLFDGPANNFGQYGRSIDVEGERVIVGHRSIATTAPGDAPRIHLYESTPSGWSRVRTELSPAGAVDDGFGVAVALTADEALVGAPDADLPFQNAGQVWALDVRPLTASPGSISLSAGGSQEFDLVGGTQRAGFLYLISGSVTGTSPGTPVDGVVLPLVVDGYTLSLLTSFGGLPIPQALGFLDGEGRATAAMILPAGTDPSLAGVTGYHAFVTLNPLVLVAEFASNAVEVELVP